MKSIYGFLATGLLVILLHSFAFAYCPSGLITYWKLDESSGTTFEDSSENPLTLPGTCTSCPAPSDGRVGGGQQFSANTISVPANSVFDWPFTDSFSIEVWMKRSGTASGDEVLVGRAEDGGSLQWWVGINGSGKAFARLVAANGSGASHDATGGPDLTDGEWHHIVFVRNAATSQNKLFVDSVNEDNNTVNYTGGFSSASAPVEIGSLNGTRFFNGVIDEVAIHHRVLTSAQIVQHYKDGTIGLRAGYCSPVSMIRIMPLGDSITRGSHSTNSNGYRKELDMDLSDYDSDGHLDYDFDFVGNQDDGDGTFDTDHEGHSGWTTDDIRDQVITFLNNNPADVILLHIGTNDLYDLYAGTNPDVNGTISQTTSELNTLLDNIWTQAPDATVVLARIVLWGTSDPSDPNDYNHRYNDAVEALANTRISNGDRLVMADHESALTYPNDMSDDDVHPNDSGYSKMAGVWYSALSEFLPPTNEVTLDIISQPIEVANLGTTYTYDVEAQATPAATFTLTNKPAGMTIDTNTGIISWNPNPPSGSTADVTVRADNGIENDTQSFQIEVNTPPLADDDSYTTAKGDTLDVSAAQGVLNGDTDADGDTLQAQLVSGPAHGALTLNTDGSFTYVHDGGDTPLDSFAYSAWDGKGFSSVATASITVTGVNVKPVITGQSSLSVAAGSSLTIELKHLNVTDPDSKWPNDFTLTVYSSGANYTVSANNQITPNSGFTGKLTVPVSVNDGNSESDVFNLSVTVTAANSGDGGGGGGGGCFISTAGF